MRLWVHWLLLGVSALAFASPTLSTMEALVQLFDSADLRSPQGLPQLQKLPPAERLRLSEWLIAIAGGANPEGKALLEKNGIAVQDESIATVIHRIGDVAGKLAPRLRTNLVKGNPAARATAARVLGAWRDTNAFPLLVASAKGDSDLKVRAAAGTAMLNVNPGAAVPEIERIIFDSRTGPALVDSLVDSMYRAPWRRDLSTLCARILQAPRGAFSEVSRALAIGIMNPVPLPQPHGDESVKTAGHLLRNETAPMVLERLRALLLSLSESQQRALIPDLKAAVGSGPLETRRAAARVLGGLQERSALPALLKLLELTPNAEHTPGKLATLFSTTTGALEEMGELTPNLPRVAAALGNFLRLSRDVNANTSVATLLERLRPGGNRQEGSPHPPITKATRDFDAAFEKSYLNGKAAKADACKTATTLVEKVGDWAHERYTKNSEGKGYGSAQESAVKSLGALFLFKASPLSPRANQMAEAILRETLDEIAKKKSLAPTSPFSGVEKMAGNIRQETKREGLSSGTEIYAQVYHLLLLREMGRRSGLTDDSRADLKKLADDAETSLNDSLGSFEKYMEGGSSIYSTYAFAVALAASSRPPPGAIERMNRMIEKNADLPVSLPYHPTLRTGEGARASAARAVPFYLAAYLHSTGKARVQARQNLLAALRNFTAHSPYLLAHCQRVNCHVGADRMAQYYYYPAVPYATAAVHMLSQSDPSPEEETELTNLQGRMSAHLGSMLEGSGLFRPQGESESPTWVNPLSGLALLALLEECNGRRGALPGIIERESWNRGLEKRH